MEIIFSRRWFAHYALISSFEMKLLLSRCRLASVFNSNELKLQFGLSLRVCECHHNRASLLLGVYVWHLSWFELVISDFISAWIVSDWFESAPTSNNVMEIDFSVIFIYHLYYKVECKFGNDNITIVDLPIFSLYSNILHG